MRNNKVIWFLLLVFALAIFAGCSSPQKKIGDMPAPPNPASGISNEDPVSIISQMNQTTDSIIANVQNNKMIEVNQGAASLVTLNDRLAQHLTDAAYRESLRQAITNLNSLVNAQNPSQQQILAQAHSIKTMLGQAQSKTMR